MLTGYSIRSASLDLLRALVVIPPLLLLGGWTGLGILGDPGAPVVLVQVAENLAALDRDYRPTLHEIVLADMLDQGRRLEIIECVNPAVFCLSLSSSWRRS